MTSTGAGQATTILIVDDEDIVRDTCTAMLESLGFASISARDGREGVDMFTRHRDVVAAVVMDLTMPIMNGEQALRALRALSPELPVLITSGFYPPEVAARLGEQRRVAFLKKPYLSSDLSRALRTLLNT
jgi:two-component system, cell cycle sensor histidine kinase and response regulator CckA